jgi:hypothetical protein
LKRVHKTKIVGVAGISKSKKKSLDVYSIENDPMAQLLIADGFREMTDAEYEEVRPYLKPKKK